VTRRCKVCDRSPDGTLYPLEVWITIGTDIFCGGCYRRSEQQIREREKQDKETSPS
jgi:hypothetical protein